MPFMQVVTDAIANPKQVRLSQERASARTYSHLEPKMKGIRDISPEYMPGVYGTATHRTASTFSPRPSSTTSSKTPSRARSQDRSVPKPPSSLKSPPPTRPVTQLQRSYSEIPFQNKPEFPPDITAADLTADQIKRNYSCDNLTTTTTSKHDFSKNILPPLNNMQGFGRFRVAINAEPGWRAQNVMRQTKDIESLSGMTADLDMEAFTGLPNQDWQVLTGSGSRRGSTISLLSTMTDSSSSPLELSGRIARGFSPSGSSSKSSQTAYSHRRKGSNLSMILPVDSSPPSVPIALKRTSTIHSERRGSGLLSTIEELHTNPAVFAEGRRKIEKPCEFSDERDPDSAVASDAEDDDSWSDVAETNPTKVSAITQMLKEGKIQQQPQPALTRARTLSTDMKRVRGSTTALDRSRTIRAARPEVNRRQSRTKSSNESKTSEQKKNDKTKGDEIAENAQKSPPGLEIQIVKPSKTQIKHQPSKELIMDQILKNATIGEKKTTQHPHVARNRSTTVVFRADPEIGRNNGQTQLAYVAK